MDGFKFVMSHKWFFLLFFYFEMDFQTSSQKTLAYVLSLSLVVTEAANSNGMD